MCGRYANHVEKIRGWVQILIDWQAGTRVSYNIAPTQIAPIVTATGAIAAKWSLIPHWSKTDQLKYSTFNARVESMAEKPAFRSA